MRYRKKPVEVEAMQFNANNGPEICRWSHGQVGMNVAGNSLAIHTPEGVMYAYWGDWIIRGVASEYYPCKPKIFDATYDEAKQ